MTDDHVEKILDAGLVRDGARHIWFANNGGREPFQMYAIALASYLPSLDINHFTIKWVSSVESLLNPNATKAIITKVGMNSRIRLKR